MTPPTSAAACRWRTLQAEMARLTDRIAAANAGALDRLARSAPVLSGVRDARALVPALSGRTLLHAGPPIAPAALCGPMRGAVLGAALLEGWADTADEATPPPGS